MKHSFFIKPYAASAQVCWNIGDPGRAPEVQTVLDRSGFPYRYMPSYSPDLKPIEPGWANVKAYLRRVAACTIAALNTRLVPLSTASSFRMPQLLPTLWLCPARTSLTKSH